MDRSELPRLYRLVRLLFLYNNKPRNPLAIADALNKLNPAMQLTEAAILEALTYATICEDWSELDIEIKYRSPKSRRQSRAKSTLLKDLCYQLVLHPSSNNHD
jgi:hypothetical protein